MEKIENYEQVKEFITAEIHNVLWIKPYLAERPFTQIYDMVVTYNVELDGEKNAVTPVTWELFQNYGVDLKEFHEAAVRNTTRLHPPVINAAEETRTSDYPDENVYVFTNREGKNAAVSILDPKAMDTVAERIGEDFFLIPSSTGELLFCDKNVYYETDLEDMVLEANENLDKNSILSSGVFTLDLKEHSLVNLTDRLKNPMVQMPHLWMNWADGKFPPIEGKDRTELEDVLWSGIPEDERGFKEVGIYRLKDNPELEPYRNNSISELMEKGILGENYEEIIPENYDLIYVSSGDYYPWLFPYETGDDGPSPCVGDIMVLHCTGYSEEVYYYNEQNGFELIDHPDFLERLMDIYFGLNDKSWLVPSTDMEKHEAVPESGTEEKKPATAIKKKPEASGPKL